MHSNVHILNNVSALSSPRLLKKKKKLCISVISDMDLISVQDQKQQTISKSSTDVYARACCKIDS